MATTYTPKNILITGAAGFIASHVANRIISKYPHYKVVVLDKLDYCSNLRNLNPSRSSVNFKFIKGDILSADLVKFILLSESIDTIMHFAAQTHVDNSFGNSFEFTKNNIYGTHVLLEGCKVTGKIKRFIHVSTDEVYGETNGDAVVGNHEASQLCPTNPYSATKAGAEMLVMAYARSHGLPVITTRGNNVYGPKQFPEKLIPKLILLAMKGQPLPIYGDGSNERSYMYCEDAADAFEVILHRGEVGHVYNIGTDKERRVIDVATDICKIFSFNPDAAIKFVEDRPFNDRRYFLDHQKLKNLGWAERTTWQEGLMKTVRWYISNSDWWGDVSGALLPHPKMLMMPGVEKKFEGLDVNDSILIPAASSPKSSTMASPVAEGFCAQKPSYKFLNSFSRLDVDDFTSIPAASSPKSSTMASPVAEGFTAQKPSYYKFLNSFSRLDVNDSTPIPAANSPKSSTMATPVADVSSAQEPSYKFLSSFSRLEAYDSTSIPAANLPKSSTMATPNAEGFSASYKFLSSFS